MSKGKDFKFQIKLGGEFKDFAPKEDKLLKQAFLSGFPNAKYQSRGQKYEVDFKRMVQRNIQSGKERDMRPPHKWKAPVAPIMEAGPTTCIKVPPGAPGTTIQVPHPRDKGKLIGVSVPATARPGQPMMVPVPPLEEACVGSAVDEPAAPSAPAPGAAAPGAAAARPEKKGWSTAGKVAAGTAGVAAVAGLAVGGVILGEHIAEEGWDATMEDLGDWAGDAGHAIAGAAETAGEGIVDGAEAAADWVGDAADTAGDFIMDLF